MSALKLIFAGTPEFAASILEALCLRGYRPHLVLTQPDRPQGRGRKLTASAVKAFSEAQQLPVFQPATLSAKRDEGQAAIDYVTATPFDVLIVAAYGLMIPKKLLEFPTYGALNVHASLLPRWRGAAPVEHAIMNGDRETGVALMQMDTGLDTGAVLARSTLEIQPEDSGSEVTARLAELGARLLCEKLPSLATMVAEPQDESLATYAPKLSAEIAAIRWFRSAAQIHDQVRALSGRETAWTRLRHGEQDIRLRVHAGRVIDTTTIGSPGQIIAHARQDLIVVQTGCGLYGVSHLQVSVGKGTIQPAAAARNGFGFLKPGHHLVPEPAA